MRASVWTGRAAAGAVGGTDGRVGGGDSKGATSDGEGAGGGTGGWPGGGDGKGAMSSGEGVGGGVGGWPSGGDRLTQNKQNLHPNEFIVRWEIKVHLT